MSPSSEELKAIRRHNKREYRKRLKIYRPRRYEENMRKARERQGERKSMASQKAAAKTAAEQKATYDLYVATVVKVGEAAGVATGIDSPPQKKLSLLVESTKQNQQDDLGVTAAVAATAAVA